MASVIGRPSELGAGGGERSDSDVLVVHTNPCLALDDAEVDKKGIPEEGGCPAQSPEQQDTVPGIIGVPSEPQKANSNEDTEEGRLLISAEPCTQWPAPEQNSWELSFVGTVSVLCLIVQNSAAVLIMRYTLVHPDQRRYLPATAVIAAEALKTMVSAMLVVIQNGTMRGVFSNGLELLKTSVPALLYLIQNNLQYVAVKNLHAATYQVIYQLKVLTAALLWVIVFRTCLSWTRWIALVVLVVGVICVRLEGIDDSKATANVNFGVGMVATVAATFTSALAGVYFEKLLKNCSKLTVWQRNVQLGGYSMLFGFAGLIPMGLWKDIYEEGFFQGYTSVTFVSVVIQGGGGLIIGVLLKYANVILKDISTTVSITLSCFLSWLFLDQTIGHLFVVGVILVSISVYAYSKG